MSRDGWKPWRALREQAAVEFDLVDMPAGWGRGVLAQEDDLAVILVDRNLPPAERLAVLAHELVHLERGGVADHRDAPSSWAPVVAKEELIVDRIVAERLVPRAELERFVDGRSSVGPVTALDVADEFDVSVEVAQRALVILKGRLRLAG